MPIRQGSQACEEWRNPITLELLAKNGDAAFVDAVNLEHVLGQIQADGRDLHELPPSCKRARSPAPTVAPAVTGERGRPFH